MKNINSLLKHELLNILTLFMFWIMEGEFANPSEKLELLKTASFLIKHEDIFLDKKPNFFLQELSLNEILETMCIIHDKKIKSRKIKIEKLSHPIILKMDRYYLGEALEQIFSRLLDYSTEIKFEYNKDNNSLIIFHNSIKDIVKTDLISCLNQKEIDNHELGFQLGLKILTHYNKEPIMDNHTIEVFL